MKKTKKELTNTQKINLLWKECQEWNQNNDYDGDLEYAINNGYKHWAVHLWVNSGASQYDFDIISSPQAEKERKMICDEAIFYECPDCNHIGMYSDHQGDEISCMSCGETAYLEEK